MSRNREALEAGGPKARPQVGLKAAKRDLAAEGRAAALPFREGQSLSDSCSGSAREVSAEVRVRYADTDQMGVAYYANYLIWFEVGRNEYMRASGYPYLRLEQEDVRMPVVEASCRYLSPARYDDVVEVRTRIEEVGPASVRFAYRVLRKEDGLLLATGVTRHAAVAGHGRPRRIPDEVTRCLRG